MTSPGTTALSSGAAIGVRSISSPWPSARITSAPSRGRRIADVLGDLAIGARSGPPRRRRRGHRPRPEPPGPPAHRTAPAPARHAELARPLPDAIAERLPGAALDAPGRGHRARPRRPLGRRRVGHLVGEVALLPGADRRGGQRPDPAGHRAGAVPHQGAGPRPAARAHRPRAPRRGRRRLRRRRQPRGAHLGPQARVGRAHQPGDAPLRAAAPPRALGHVPRPPALHRARRAAHLPRRVRQPRGAARAAGCGGWPSTTAPIPCSSARRPRSARRSALATAVCGAEVVPGARRRLSERSPHRRPVAAAAARRAHRRSRLGAPRGGRADRRAHRQRAHHARLRPQPPRGGDRGRRRAPPTAAVAGRAGAGLPRRLPRRGAPRHRGRAVRRAAHRRGGHVGARARHRRRRSRRRGDRRLPRHHRVVPAAGRTSGPVRRCRRRRCSSPAATSSTSGWPRNPRSSSPERPSRRW